MQLHCKSAYVKTLCLGPCGQISIKGQNQWQCLNFDHTELYQFLSDHDGNFRILKHAKWTFWWQCTLNSQLKKSKSQIFIMCHEPLKMSTKTQSSHHSDFFLTNGAGSVAILSLERCLPSFMELRHRNLEKSPDTSIKRTFDCGCPGPVSTSP